ncbi:MAG: hypothetical protein Q8Q09_11275 [Deltaproteobacteria bacterium]|nr:hypothetical protein [Deltaproteobacteria bacterium]
MDIGLKPLGLDLDLERELDLGGCPELDRRMKSATIGEDLHGLAECASKLMEVAVALAMNELVLERPKKFSATALSQQFPLRLMLTTTPRSLHCI